MHLLIQLKMATVDMTYRFIWDEDPTEEQLEILMQEVGEDICREQIEVIRKWEENMQFEMAGIHAKYSNKQGKTNGKT